MYVLLAGNLPFFGENEEEIKANILHGVPEYNGKYYFNLEPVWSEI